MKNVGLLKTNNVDVDASLQLWGDMDSYNESLKEFKDSLSSKLANLEQYKITGDLNNYAILAHSMKSEAKYLGFMKDAEVFLSHELNGKQNNREFIENNFENLRSTVQNIISLLNNYFGEENNNSILIVDDSNIVLNFLEKSIDKKFKILKAKDGNEALSFIANNDIYAVLLDLNMPGISGFEVLNYLKDNNLINRFPIIIITGDDTEETIKKAFNYPILDVLNKPFNEKNIERILEKIKGFYDNKK